MRWIAFIIDITERRAQQEALRASRDQIAAQAGQLEQQNEALMENVRLREEVERIAAAMTSRRRSTASSPCPACCARSAPERRGRRTAGCGGARGLPHPEHGQPVAGPVQDGKRQLHLPPRCGGPGDACWTRCSGQDLRSHAASKGVMLKLDVRLMVMRLPTCWAEELLCYSLLANLVKNALEASPEGATVTNDAGRNRQRR
jgi:hypothetical protein